MILKRTKLLHLFQKAYTPQYYMPSDATLNFIMPLFPGPSSKSKQKLDLKVIQIEYSSHLNNPDKTNET